jgi:cell filamentation protein
LALNNREIDKRSLEKAYQLFETKEIEKLEVGTAKGLQQVHHYLFKNLVPYAGKVRSKNISKGGFTFASALYLPNILSSIDAMPEATFEQIVLKYIDMNIAHPFMDGNGRATRIWLDQLLKKRLQRIVDWQRISKALYFEAMEKSALHEQLLIDLLSEHVTTDTENLEVIKKGIDQSFYYEGYSKDR